MVLTHDSIATSEAAMEEGRSVFDNLTKFLVCTIPTNASEAVTLPVAFLLGLSQLPILPVQLLWINMATALLLGLMLVFEPKEPDLIRRPPRNPTSPLVIRPLFLRTVLVTLLMLAGTLNLFVWENGRGAPVVAACTTVVNVIVLTEVFYLLACCSLNVLGPGVGPVFQPAPPWWCGPDRAGAGGLHVLAAGQLPFSQRATSMGFLAGAFRVRLMAYGLVELEKAVRFRATASISTWRDSCWRLRRRAGCGARAG
jgi:hypothetical protein